MVWLYKHVSTKTYQVKQKDKQIKQVVAKTRFYAFWAFPPIYFTLQTTCCVLTINRMRNRTDQYNQSITLHTQKMINDIIKMQYDQFSGQIRSIGSWSFHQNLLYVIFLQKNKLIMISKKKRRNLRIFDRMSDLITTRNSLQCRSHHQKLLEKFREVKVIISNFKKYISKQDFKTRFLEIYGDDKSKLQVLPEAVVKEQELSQEAEQIGIKLQDNAPAIIQHKVEETVQFYNQYLNQIGLQLGQYSFLNFYYSGLQLIP